MVNQYLQFLLLYLGSVGWNQPRKDPSPGFHSAGLFLRHSGTQKRFNSENNTLCNAIRTTGFCVFKNIMIVLFKSIELIVDYRPQSSGRWDQDWVIKFTRPNLKSTVDCLDSVYFGPYLRRLQKRFYKANKAHFRFTSGLLYRQVDLLIENLPLLVLNKS